MYVRYVGATVDDEKRVGFTEDLVADGDAVEILFQQTSQLLVLRCDYRPFLLHRDLVQQRFVVTLPEVLQRRVAPHHLYHSKRRAVGTGPADPAAAGPII